MLNYDEKFLERDHLESKIGNNIKMNVMEVVHADMDLTELTRSRL
jgi:hypothetical protein